MADHRRSRFSRIEHPRTPGEAPEPAPVAPGHVERFRPAPPPALEVEARPGDAQPFVRCCRCETDCSRYDARCSTCGEPLETDEQRTFNERLWAGRRAQAEADEAGRLEREAALQQARDEAAAARRSLAESMAWQVGEAERRRLEREGLGGLPGGVPDPGPAGGGWGHPDPTGPGGDLSSPDLPAGLRLLARLPAAWRVPAGVAAVALAALLYLWRPGAGLAAGALLLWLLTPGRWAWRRRRWW